MRPKKFRIHEWMPVIALAVVLALVPLALYLSSAFYFLAHKINPAKAGLLSWLDYFLTDASDRKKQLVSLLAGLFTTYGLIPLSIYLATQKKPSLHGDARFANVREIRKAELYSDKGIIVGRHNGRILRFPGPRFVIVAAPTRSGKGVGVVIPNCLSYEQSLVVLDLKQENFRKTARYRQEVMGQAVYLFNPFAGEPLDEGEPPTPPFTHRWNPLDVVPQGVFRIGEVMGIGRVFWPSGGKDAFWNDNALNLFVALVLILCELRDRRREEVATAGRSDLPDYPVSMGEVLRQASGRGTGKPVKEYLKNLLAQYPWLSPACRDAVASFLSSSDDVLASIISTFNAPLINWRNPVVDAATSTSDFKLTDVRKKKMTIYFGISPNRLENAAQLINLFFSQLVNLNTKQLPEDNPALKHTCLLLMDEFTAIGKVAILAKAVSYIAGYNLRLMPIIQSFSQLESVYGKEDARTFLTNHALQIVYAPRDQKDANDVSEALGYYTLKSDSRSRSTGGKGGGSISTSDQRRALMLPQEVKEIGMWKEIIFLENTKPIFCDKIKYFEDPYFEKRVMPPPPIPCLDIELFLAQQEGRMRGISNADIDIENERIAENKRAQMVALDNMDWEQPPLGANDVDWIACGARIAAANTPMATEQRQGRLSGVLKKIEQMNPETVSIQPVSQEQLDADINMLSGFAADDDIGAESDRMPNTQIDNAFAAAPLLSAITFDETPMNPQPLDVEPNARMAPSDTASTESPDPDIGIGGTPIEESDIPPEDLEEEYFGEPEVF